MTTKAKIILGFSLMVVLISILAVIGYQSAHSSSNGFIEYQRLARFNIATSDMSSSMFNATGGVYKFMLTRDAAFVDQAQGAIDSAAKHARSALELSLRAETKRTVSEMVEGVQGFRGIVNEIKGTLQDLNSYYSDVIVARTLELQQQFSNFTQASARAQDVPGLVLIAEALNRLSKATASISRFAVSRSEQDKATTETNLREMGRAIETIKGNVVSERGMQMMKELEAAFAAYANSFAELVVRSGTVGKTVETMERTFAQELKDVQELNEARDKQMRAFGVMMREESERVENGMMILGAAGLLLGLLIAMIIVTGLSRVLRTLAHFAKEVSEGNFNTAVKIREGGDIGAMVKAMQGIPEIVAKVMNDAHDLGRKILAGRFRDRMDSAPFSGGFAELAETINAVGNAYTDVLDLMPIPIKTCDTEKRIRFLNKVAQTVVGGNFVNEKCAQHIKSGVCNSSGCFGENCMKKDGIVSGETNMKPLGATIDASVTAIPLKGETGDLVGYIELITDVTEIKDKQNTIVRVANQASSIADRVAAASEEIAAQVEQISRGAEMQRQRVDTTASAMSEMNATVLEVARSAGQAAEASDVTKQRAEGGADIVRQVVGSIQSVNTVAQQMQKNMMELGEQADSVGSVMGVISDIADQTNLLALNAAIEAARAGEAGRGFAVVADEVRKLAEKTMQATQEVGTNITAIQASARRNIDAMDDVAKGVADATNLASSSGEALSEIVTLASSNSSVVASIATAAEQQSATSEEINHAIEEINRVVGETTEGMVQSASAVQELSSMTQELRNIIDSLR